MDYITFPALAKRVAADFRQTMEEEGFDTFAEMKKCYGWDKHDIMGEVESILADIRKDTGADVSITTEDDEEEAVYIGLLDLAWDGFFKMIKAELKAK